ncbi:poly-beta-1,6 N-acetyl-D-glucosamine export porin PgaA [Luteimonas aquatica]|uniref:poly-beta-1,6 N-acetyl-D-glucosamine export porin PgaA n=1 Tax=Luteimonas aquatica TaxID=450364 RepID=UPI001F5A069C|nr:poly-beta-1,6 N-acetyl-D-glucosamine export porin PgaA [Luteimonas aquatica]
MPTPSSMRRLTLALALATAATSSWAQAGASAPATLESSLGEIRQLRDQQQWQAALARIEQAAARYPDSDALYALRVHTLSEIGARERAWQLYRARPQLFSAEEAQRIELDRIARLISAGDDFVADEARRLDGARAAEAAIDDYLRRAGLDASRAPLRLRYDRLELLNQLERHREVVQEYEKLRAEGHEVPAYALIPVGASLMDQKRPKEAAPVLEKAIAAIPDGDPKKVEFQAMHAYALMESERYDLAQPELDALVAANPEWRVAPDAKEAFPNWDRYHAEINQTMVRSYGGDLAGAQKTLETMSVYGPDDSGVQSSLGSVYDRRGWHERALQRHRMAATLDPQSVDARSGQIESLLELQRSDQARPIYDELQRVYPDTLNSRTLRDRWQRYMGWQWRAFAGWGRSDANGNRSVSPVGSRDGVYGIEAETPLWDDRWRLTAGYADRYADFNDRRIHDRRGAVGVRYAYDRLDVHLQANRSFDDLDNTGASLDIGWRFSDVLDAGLALRKYDPEASLQARAFGITADSAAVSLDWHPSELTTVGATAQAYRFEDGNRRQSLGVDLDQRLLTRPHFLLNGLASIYTSRGTRDDAPYFNPSRDASMELGVRADQLVWREYERHFRHRLTATVGPYWQEGYGTAWVPSLRYEHEWQFAAGKALVYGINWSRPVYDGRRERHLGFDAEFRWGK